MFTLDRLSALRFFVLLFAANLLASALGYASYLTTEGAAGVWPATGLLLAALLRSSRRRWWLAVLASACGHVAFEQLTGRQTLLVSVMFSTINWIEPVIAALLLDRFFGGTRVLDRMQRLFALVAIGAGLAPALGATLGAWVVTQNVPEATYATVWYTWRAGDALGVLLTTPFLLTWQTRAQPGVVASRWEAAAYWLVLAVVAEESLGGGRVPFTPLPSLPYVIFPVLIWASVRFHPLVATTSLFAVGAYAILHAKLGMGPFGGSGLPAREQILALQTLLTVLSLTTLASLVLAIEYASSERERVEVELKRMRSQRVEAVGRLAAGIAHDFNNILAVVAGNGELLEKELARPVLDREEALECVRQQRNAAKRGKLMVQQLVSLVRRDAAEPITVNLNETVRMIEPMLPHLVGEHLTLEVQTANEAACTKIEPMRIETAILNLLANARDAMPNGGHLALRVAVTDAEVVLSVHDNGCGIPPENLARVREAFFTTKPPERGIGLGLTTVCETVEQVGGRLELESAVNEGTTVVCHFPRVVSKTSDQPPPVRATPSGRTRILVCEDEDSVRAVAQKFLSSAGYEVLAAPDGYTALKLLQNNPVDMVLADVAMPTMTGFALGDRVAALQPGLPVLYMSGHSDLHAGTESAKVLRKPFTRAELLDRVHAEVGPPQSS
jgi:signal transduction histidine kinase